MQTAPTGWAGLFTTAHRTEYRVVIGRTAYDMPDIKGTPKLTKPMIEKPMIGRVCSATLEVTLLTNDDIPKAARVEFYVRLTDAERTTPTDWVAQGVFYITSRAKKGNAITLKCRDAMLKTGQTYLDKTSITDFPISFSTAVSDICSIIGVEQDARNSFPSTSAFKVDPPADAVLMSEILAGIAGASGGNFVMTEEGKLRFVPFASANNIPAQALSTKYKRLTLREAGEQVISRIILVAQAGAEEYTAGDDSGYTLECVCPYANQDVADYLCNTTDGRLYAVHYLPYSLDGAILNPLLELGDSVSFTSREGSTHRAVLHSIVTSCDVAFCSDIESDFPEETEDEYPYKTASEVQSERTVTTLGRYYGNSIDHVRGFYSQLDDGAYAQFNADVLKFVDSTGRECFYYDSPSGTFKLDVNELSIIARQLNDLGVRNLIINTLEPSTDPDKCVKLYEQLSPTYVQNYTVGVATHGLRFTKGGSTSSAVLFQMGYAGSGHQYSSMNGLEVGETYTLSFDWAYKLLAASATPAYMRWRVLCYDTNNTLTPVEFAREEITRDTDSSKRVVASFTIPVNTVACALYMDFIEVSGDTVSIIPNSSVRSTDYYEFASLKLEQGETATHWTPAPEDQVGNSEIIAKINLLPSTAQIEAEHINLVGAVTITDFDSTTQAALVTATTVKNQYYLSTSSSSATGGSWQDTVPAWSSGKYAWTRVATTKTYASGSSSTTYSTGVYDANLTTALSTATSAESTAQGALASTVSCYYRSSTNSTPTISTSTTIGTSQNTDDAWTYLMPRPKNGRYFYTCEKYVANDGTVTFSTVRALANATYTSMWCSSSDATYIDGGQIYTNSITAAQIDVQDLFAQNLTASNFNITGGTINITTSSDAFSAIQLSYGTQTVAVSPAILKLENDKYGLELWSASGRIYAYRKRNGTNYTLLALDSSLGGLRLGGSSGDTVATSPGFVYLVDGGDKVGIFASTAGGASGGLFPSGLTTFKGIGFSDGTNAAWLMSLKETGLYFRNTSNKAVVELSTDKIPSGFNLAAGLLRLDATSTSVQTNVQLDPVSLRFYDSAGNLSSEYPRGGLSVVDLNDNARESIATSGTTKTYTLGGGGTYLVTTQRYANTSVAQDGVWLISAHTNTSHLTAIVTPSGSTTVSISALTLTVTTGSANVRVTITKLS